METGGEEHGAAGADALPADLAATGASIEQLNALLPFLGESLMLLSADWMVKLNVAPPAGLIGRGVGLGVHTLAYMHPDDAVRILNLGTAAFSTEPGWQGSELIRMLHADGEYRLYEITATNCLGHPHLDGMVVRTRPAPFDIPPEPHDLSTEAPLRTLSELLPIGVVLMDNAGLPVFLNDAACAMAGTDAEGLKGGGMASMFVEEDREIITTIIERLRQAPSKGSCTLRLASPAAQIVQVNLSSDGAQAVTFIAATIEDVTERESMRHLLEERASRDAMTGLLNRAALLNELESRLDEGAHPTVAFLDVNNLKRINDEYGHAAGDELIVGVANALRAQFTCATVKFGRIGGDEFVVLANGADPAELSAKVRATVARVTQADGTPASCGLGVVVAESRDDVSSLIKRADEAMYADKRANRG